ncbi:hypothetical protein DXG01_009547 [Tephrocybe rancida]|nr:hypothetical protein DXG01_009547 [Tephrocybe rancida]
MATNAFMDNQVPLAYPPASSLLNGQPSKYQDQRLTCRSRDDTPQLPLSDSNKWYYPSHGYESDDGPLEPGSRGGNWGNKTVRGARWVRKGKMTTWGPSMDDWESEERARKRIKLLLPQERRSPSPPSLPHLERSPSPPLVSPYPPPDAQHLSYASFVMDKAVTHSFRSNLIDELENATNGLIEGEATMNRAMGRLWQVINEDPENMYGQASVIPKQEDGDGDAHEEEAARRMARAPDLTPPMHKIFLLSYPSGGPQVFEPSHFASPDMQLETLEKSLATLRELHDDGREYGERLQEIRDSLGDVRAQRDGVWDLVRERAVKELHDSLSQTTIPHPMGIPDMSILAIHGTPPVDSSVPDVRSMRKLEAYASSLPYAIEPCDKMIKLLDFIILRIVQCVEAKDYDVGLNQWDSMLTYWCILKYPMPKDRRVRLAKLYFLVSTIPGMSINAVATCADAFCNLTKSKKKISIDDMRLPWKPIYEILKSDLFLKRRQFEYTQLSWCMGYIASNARRFFSPAATEEMLQTLAEMHVDPSISDPRKIAELPDDERVEGEGRPHWSQEDSKNETRWLGLYKDVGIFSEHEWHLFMCKCLASMAIPLADAGSTTTGPRADSQASFEIGRLPKPDWRIISLARIIVHSMAQDGLPAPPSNAPTPLFSPLPSGMNTPQIQNSTVKEFLAAPLGEKDKGRTYLAGSKALDSLARLIASTESFFHPSNSGAWTNDHRRLTKMMKRELVKSLRTVTLLAMFSQDSTTTQRTIAVIKGLNAIASTIVSRDIYYPGAKHLVPILHLLIPGIDLLCTTAFLVEIAQFIKFGDLTTEGDSGPTPIDTEPTLPAINAGSIPLFVLDELDSQYTDIESRLSDEEEDALLKCLEDSTGSFPDWVASFVRRVIQLLENLPDEGPDGSAGGANEIQLIDAVTGACSQICVHLSEPLYDLVLNMIFNYASTTVRPNAVRAIHQLVECVANADPVKTLAKFFSFCARNIRVELENGASSLRTTSASTPLPSDATLHWTPVRFGYFTWDNLQLLKYKDELISLFQLLHNKTYSKRGYSWSGKLLSTTLLTLTHTYPLENKFVNPEEWNAPEFRSNHHQRWGKLYTPEEVALSWHSPDEEEIQHLSFVRNAFSGIPTLFQQKITPEEAAFIAATTDILNEIPEMIASIDSIASGFCLTDPDEPHYQYMTSLRHRFGTFLHKASVSLRQQGAENTVDAVDMLIRAVRTYLLEYGDSRDSYNNNEEQYQNEKNVARTFAKQKVWPRAVYIRRARYYHSARLYWNSIERRRGPVEDALIDDIVEWSMWQYAVIRKSVYDGTRRRALPILLQALEPGTDDDRMKGALWSLNMPCLGKYAMSEPSLSPKLIKSLLGCQHNEKPSIQDCVSAMAENGLGSFLEPNYLVYNISTPRVDTAISQLRATLGPESDHKERDLVVRLRDRRVERIQFLEDAAQANISNILEVGESDWIHWRYEIVATRALRTLVRRDAPTSSNHLQYFLGRVCDDHPTIRYYSQRAITKIARNIKLRTFCMTPTDLALMRVRNPLKMKIEFAIKVSFYRLFLDREPPGWVAWDDSVTQYLPPSPTKSVFSAWDPSSKETLEALRTTVTKPEFWEELAEHYAEENHETTITQDNVSFVKSIFQLLEDGPLEALRPTLEQLLQNKDQNKQRAAAEFVAGVLGGSKHWPTSKQESVWNWFQPYLKQIFIQNVKTDTLMIWTTFFEVLPTFAAHQTCTNRCQYIFFRTDPRRVQPLVDFIVTEFKNIDYNAEMTFDGIKVLSLFRAFYEELGRKFDAWTEDTLSRTWGEINSEHDDLRAYIGEILAFTQKIKASSIFSGQLHIKMKCVVGPQAYLANNRECRVVPQEFDIMGMRGLYHKERVLELVGRFEVWKDERLPGSRRPGVQMALQLSARRACNLHIRLYSALVVHDNTELSNRASTLLVRMCGVTPPLPMVGQLLDGIFDAIRTSPSWRIRLKALPLVQVFYFRQVPLIPEIKIVQILEVLCSCLDDEVVEVREMAATTLSGILRLSPRRSVLTLKRLTPSKQDRFVCLAKKSRIPPRQDPGYNKAIRQRHAAILGICALVDSYPYTVEKWMPALLTNVLAEHTYDPIPISTTVRKCASNFKRTHQDTWHEDSKRFDEDQLAALSTLLTGSSYYA